jgi:hypothetical protein
MQMHLSAFLRDQARSGFGWGDHDCLTFLADWWRMSTGIDPLAPWRGAWDNQQDAEAITASWGGFGRMVREMFARIDVRPLPRAAAPMPGDCGIVRHLGDVKCGVRTLTGWAFRSREGVIVARDHVEPAMLWRPHD